MNRNERGRQLRRPYFQGRSHQRQRPGRDIGSRRRSAGFDSLTLSGRHSSLMTICRVAGIAAAEVISLSS